MTRLNTDYFDIPAEPPSRFDPAPTYRPSPRRCFFCGLGVSADAPVRDRPPHAIARLESGAFAHRPK